MNENYLTATNEILNKLKYKNNKINDTLDNIINVLHELETLYKKPVIVFYEENNKNCFYYVHESQVNSSNKKIFSCYSAFYDQLTTDKQQAKKLKDINTKFYKKLRTFLTNIGYLEYGTTAIYQ